MDAAVAPVVSAARPHPAPPVDRVALHASEWALIHGQYPAAQDVSTQLPPWTIPGITLGALGYLPGGIGSTPGPHYLVVKNGSEGLAPIPFARSAREPFPIGTLASFVANQPGVRASRIAISHIDGELWLAGSNAAYVELGRLPGSMHRAVVEGPRGATSSPSTTARWTPTPST